MSKGINPFFSIIIPLFNREKFIINTLESVRSQIFQNWECIIIDDDCTDNSYGVAAKYIKNDNRFILTKRIESFKKGASGSRNYGIELSRGEYIKWLDSDDLLANEILQHEYDTIQNTTCDLTVCAWKYFDNKNTNYPIVNRLVKTAFNDGLEILKFIGETAEFNPPGVYSLRKKYILKTGFWNESMSINDDGEFFFRVLVNVKNISAIDYLGFFYRKDSTDQLSKDSTKFLILLNNWKYIEAYANAMNLNVYKYLNYGKWSSFNKLLSIKEYKTIWKERQFFSSIMNSFTLLKFISINIFLRK